MGGKKVPEKPQQNPSRGRVGTFVRRNKNSAAYSSYSTRSKRCLASISGRFIGSSRGCV